MTLQMMHCTKFFFFGVILCNTICCSRVSPISRDQNNIIKDHEQTQKIRSKRNPLEIGFVSFEVAQHHGIHIPKSSSAVIAHDLSIIHQDHHKIFKPATILYQEHPISEPSHEKVSITHGHEIIEFHEDHLKHGHVLIPIVPISHSHAHVMSNITHVAHHHLAKVPIIVPLVLPKTSSIKHHVIVLPHVIMDGGALHHVTDHEDGKFRSHLGGFGTGLDFGGHGAGHGYFV